MLFLAVFCGFLAEYKLEQTIERHREKEFIGSMLEDAANDTAHIRETISANQARIFYLDSLALACYEYQGTQAQSSRLYFLNKKTLYRPDLLYPTDRTIFQLKNAGGMRLIRKKAAANAIINYDNTGKQVLNQQVYYENYLNELTACATGLFNFPELMARMDNRAEHLETARLISEDRSALMKMGNQAKMFQGILKQYINRLNEMRDQALQLMEILNKEYHIH